MKLEQRELQQHLRSFESTAVLRAYGQFWEAQLQQGSFSSLSRLQLWRSLLQLEHQQLIEATAWHFASLDEAALALVADHF